MRLEIHHINVSQGDATLIINRDLDALKKIIEQKGVTPPTEPDKLMPFAIHKEISLEGTVKYAVLLDMGEAYYGGDVFEYMQKYGVKGEATRENFRTIVTHYHSDHMGGINDIFNKKGPTWDKNKTDIARNYPPPRAYDIGDNSDFDPDTGILQTYLQEIGHNVRAKIFRAPFKVAEYLTIDKGVNNIPITLTCLASDRNVWGEGALAPKYKNDQNARSLVFILEYGPFRYFLGGDIGGNGGEGGGNEGQNADSRNLKGFQKLVSSHDDIETSIRKVLIRQYEKTDKTPAGHVCAFKANHHGSASSNDVFLLATMRPKIVLISSGTATTFHRHPTQEVINRIDKDKTLTWKDHNNNTIDNSIENYYITEMAKDSAKKKFTRELPNGRIIGDIIVRPNDDDIKDGGENGVRMQVYGTGAQAAVGEGYLELRDAKMSDPLIPTQADGPWEHKCGLH